MNVHVSMLKYSYLRTVSKGDNPNYRYLDKFKINRNERYEVFLLIKDICALIYKEGEEIVKHLEDLIMSKYNHIINRQDLKKTILTYLCENLTGQDKQVAIIRFRQEYLGR